MLLTFNPPTALSIFLENWNSVILPLPLGTKEIMLLSPKEDEIQLQGNQQYQILTQHEKLCGSGLGTLTNK